jgi:hypothetical protein
MRRQSSRNVFERYVMRHPHLYALLLVLRNRVSRWWLDQPIVLGVSVAVCLSGITGVVLAIYSLGPRQINQWLSYLDRHAIWLLLIAAVHAAITVVKRRQQVSAAIRSSWLAAAPRSALTMRTSIIVAVLWVPVVQLGIALTMLLILQIVGQSDALVVRHLMAIVVAGFVGGILLGSVLARKKGADRPGSRYVPGKSQALASSTASLKALSRWPVTAAFAWATPDTVRWPLMVAMLSVMAGSSAVAGLVVVGFWMLIVYVAALFASTLRVTNEAALWLRATPLSFVRFATAIGARSLVHQLLATAVIAAVVTLESKSLWQSILFVLPWIAFVMVAYATTIAYAFRARRGTRASIVLSAVSIAIIEFLQRGAAVPFALLVCGWQFSLGLHHKYRAGELHASA